MNNLASKFPSGPVGDFLASDFELPTETINFEEAVLPHMDAAYNLARWLTRNDDDAEDVVQESLLRALKFFGGFRGSEGRPWLLTIVRNTYRSWLKRNRSTELAEFDEATYLGETDASDPETSSVRSAQKRLVREALERLSFEFREVMVMRELEERSYREIAALVGIPVGTVMSRLARARKKLHASLAPERSSRLPRASSLRSQTCGKQAECMSWSRE
jgi:RNA polymerase sigma factor (sigma-70 family)